MKVYLSTLGCKLNESELEAWARQFARDGYEIVDDVRDADLCVLNTCTITHIAARKSRQLARQLARTNPHARLVLTGCHVTVAPDEVKSLPNVALVVPNAEKERLVALAEFEIHNSNLQSRISNLPPPNSKFQCPIENRKSAIENHKSETIHPTSEIPHPRTRAFVKIQDGCNMSCSYCIIPLARGKERSRSHEEIVAEVKWLVGAGYKEIVLTGVQISAYEDCEANLKFALRDLVAAILAETDVPRLRLSSIAPWDVDESLLALWRDPRLCRHLHLSLQSGCDAVLQRMRRPYTTAQLARVAELAREHIPDVGITTDVIVGFPGESEAEFEQSLGFVETMRFSRVHVFPYSPRAGTLAATMPQVANAVRESRASRMQVVADASLGAFARRFVGRTMQVLWETSADDRLPTADDGGQRSAVGGLWSGYTDNYIRVFTASATWLMNQIASARLVDVIDGGAAAVL